MKRLLFCFALFEVGCVAHYENALGYRAHQAVLAGDARAFEDLMKEASETLPAHPFDNPKRLVLTHFLDLGGSDLFFPTIDRWTELGWVSEHATCSIHRARWRGVHEKDPVEATRVAEICVERARDAAQDPSTSWEVSACLAEAPFLTVMSTEALRPFLMYAADPAEPDNFRAALLDGMTHLFLQDARTLRSNDDKLGDAEAEAQSLAQFEATRARFEFVIRSVQSTTEATLLGSATAFGAMELEREALARGKSVVAEYALSTPDDADLAWAWVRSSKANKRVARQESLGLWDRKREPSEDVYWYTCDGSTVRENEALDVTQVRCPSRVVRGPYPLEATARLAR